MKNFFDGNQQDKDLPSQDSGRSSYINKNIQFQNFQINNDSQSNRQKSNQEENQTHDTQKPYHEFGYYSGDEMEIPYSKEKQQESVKVGKIELKKSKEKVELFQGGSRQMYQEEFQKNNENQNLTCKKIVNIQLEFEQDEHEKVIEHSEQAQQTQENLNELNQNQNNKDARTKNNITYKLEEPEFKMPKSKKQLFKDINLLIKHHLFILDSINRLPAYNTQYLTFWRYQINGLFGFQRYQLYIRLKKMKMLINKLEYFSNGIGDLFQEQDVNYVLIDETLKMLKKLEFDIQHLNLETVKSIQIEILKICELESSCCFPQTLQFCQNNKVLLTILAFSLKVINFDLILNRVLKCQLCDFSTNVVSEITQHIFNQHLQFLKIFNSSATCFQCDNLKKDYKQCYQQHSIRHILDNHSEFFCKEKPFRQIFLYDLVSYYDQNQRNVCQIIEKELSNILQKQDEVLKEKIDNFFKDNLQRKGTKLKALKLIIQKHFDDYDQLVKLETLNNFDQQSIYLSITIQKLKNQLKGGATIKPSELSSIIELQNVISLEFQQRLLDFVQIGNILQQIYRKLLIGYYNSQFAQEEFMILLKRMEDFIFEMGLFDCVLNRNSMEVGFRCLMEGALCKKNFKNFKEAYSHYFFGHSGIAQCLSNCNFNIQNAKIDELTTHCYDNHQANLKDYIKNYLKAKKEEYQFKAVCLKCYVILNSMEEIYWVKLDKYQQQKFSFKIDWLIWKEIICTYQEKPFESVQFDELVNQYNEHIENNKQQFQKKISFNDKGEVTVCKNCKTNKIPKFTYLNENQFKVQENKPTIPLARSKAFITRQLGNSKKTTYPFLIGNFFTYGMKPLLLIEDVDAVYQIDCAEMKRREKFKLIGESNAQRRQIIEQCRTSHFINNHCYQMISISQLLVRQQRDLLVLNKQLWKRYLEDQNINDPIDKLQVEFTKLQDMILFDDIIHRTQAQYVFENLQLPNNKLMPNLIQEIKLIVQKRITGEFQKRLIELISDFEILNNENKQFWKITLWLFQYCKLRDNQVNSCVEGGLFMSLVEYIMFQDEQNLLNCFINRYLFHYVELLNKNQIHPLYLGVIYQLKYQIFINQGIVLSENQRMIINTIFEILAKETILKCLPNQQCVNQIKFDNAFQEKRQIYLQKSKLFEIIFLDQLDSIQFVDMNCRIKLIKKAFLSIAKNEDQQEIMQTDLRWTAQFAAIFLDSLKALREHVKDTERSIVQQHIKGLKPLKNEVRKYFNKHVAHKNQDFLTREYKNILEGILTQEFLQKNNQQNDVQEYDWLKKMYIVCFIPVEKKFQDFVKSIQVIKDIIHKEPYYEIGNYYNILSYQKEIEYALFPELFKKAEGGLITKAPDPKKFQLVLQLLKDDEYQAKKYFQNLDQIRQNNIHEEIVYDKANVKDNKIILNLELYDFATKQSQGDDNQKLKQAVFNMVKEPCLRDDSSLSYVYDAQKLAPYTYENKRIISSQQEDEELDLPQIIDLQLKIKNDYLQSTVVERHVVANLDKYITQNQQKWDNEQKQFVKRIENQVNKMKREKKLESQIDEYIIQQEKLFLQKKIQDEISARQFNNVLEQFRQVQRIDINSPHSISIIESSEEEDERKKQDNLNRLQNQIKQSTSEIRQNQRIKSEMNKVRIAQRKEMIRETQQLLLFSKTSVPITDDTKFRLKCIFTSEFQRSVSWIFWRYFEWMKQSFYCYQLIVNKEKGVIFSESQKTFQSIPPIFGSESYFQEEHAKMQQFCFQKGNPLLFITITQNEFDEKNFKVMRGLNCFDLEDKELLEKANKKNIRDPEIIEKSLDFVVYYTYLMKHFKKVIQNCYKIQKNPRKNFPNYELGMFGPCKGYIIRTETQTRGSLHYHMFIFLECNDDSYQENLIQYLKGELSHFNSAQADDRTFFARYSLFHYCQEDKCLIKGTQICRQGFPVKPTQGHYILTNPVEISPRRLNYDDERVIVFSKDVVKYFQSNCQINICKDEEVLGYLSKYATQSPNTKKTLESKQTIEMKIDEESHQQKTKIMDQVKDFFDNKLTSVQEAYQAFLSIQPFETSYRTIQLKQIALTHQVENDENNIDRLIVDKLQDFFDINQISNSWYRYQNRPNEFEYLNFQEYYSLTIFYGKKKKYLDKIKVQKEKNITQEEFIYFFDNNCNVIKLREKSEKTVTILKTSHLYANENYQGPDNVYWLLMLQLYYPHRFKSWIELTQDKKDGYKRGLEQIIDNYTYPEDETIQTYFRKKYAKYQQYSIRRYVDEYNNLNQHQKRMLNNLYKFSFGLNCYDKNQSQTLKTDYIKSLIKMIQQNLDDQITLVDIEKVKELVFCLDLENQFSDQNIEIIKNNIEQIREIVQKQWRNLNQNTKNIILNIGLIMRELGSPILYETCPGQKLEAIQSKRKQFKEQNLANSIAQTQEILVQSQIQDDVQINLASQYRNAITNNEYEEGKIYKVIYFKIEYISQQSRQIWIQLNQQQKLGVLMMIINLELTFNQLPEIRMYEGTFIHGPGGVGKSHIIMFMVQLSFDFKMNYYILSPTQQAVQNLISICKNNFSEILNAQTIHSFFGLRFGQTISDLWIELEKHLKHQGINNFKNSNEIFQNVLRYRFSNYQKLTKVLRDVDMIIIEEISMIDSLFLDLLDIYSQIARQQSLPFGGIQVFVFGDSFQLQPVQERQKFYFQSSIFENGYFKNMLELTQPVRQSEDKDFYNNILMPIRRGNFHKNVSNFKIQIQNLKNRVVPLLTIGQVPRIRNQLDELYQKKKQILSLFFKNTNVEVENYKRAKKMIDQYDQTLKNSNIATYKKYINQPLQFGFEYKNNTQEEMVFIIGQNYQFKKKFLNNDLNFENHFLLLPVGIRNYLAMKLGQASLKMGIQNKEVNKNCVQEELILFKGAELVIRNNIEKNNQVINGQFAKVSDILFDVDFKAQKNMKKFRDQQLKYCQENNLYDILEEVITYPSFKFTNDQLAELKQQAEIGKFNNVNYLLERNIQLQEKLQLYQYNVDPRLQKLILQIENVGNVELDLFKKKFIQRVSVQRQNFYNIFNDTLNQINQTIEQLKYVQGKLPKQQKEKVFQYLKNNGLIRLFYIDIINEKFSIEYLTQTKENLQFMIDKMPEIVPVIIHQLPLNLGYARTIHTAQGATLENVIVDLDIPEQQQHGLLYTALSRVKRLENLFFTGNFSEEIFKVRVNEYIQSFFVNNFKEAQQYLVDKVLLDCISKDILEIFQEVNELPQEIRLKIMQLKPYLRQII